MLRRLANFRPEWKISLFTLIMFPLFIKLGLWQLEREQEKVALQETWQERQAGIPRPLAELDAAQADDDLQYMLVELTGRYDNARTFLLDNRIHRGRVGYEVISPFLTENDRAVLINRGWAPQGRYRSDLPAIPPVPGQVTLTGTVYVPLGDQVMLGQDAEQSGWPRVVQELEPSAMFEQLALPDSVATFPHTIRLEENEPGVLVRDWPLVSTSPAKHRGYAVQWFAMAAMLLLLYLYVSTRKQASAQDGVDKKPSPDDARGKK